MTEEREEDLRMEDWSECGNGLPYGGMEGALLDPEEEEFDEDGPREYTRGGDEYGGD